MISPNDREPASLPVRGLPNELPIEIVLKSLAYIRPGSEIGGFRRDDRSMDRGAFFALRRVSRVIKHEVETLNRAFYQEFCHMYANDCIPVVFRWACRVYATRPRAEDDAWLDEMDHICQSSTFTRVEGGLVYRMAHAAEGLAFCRMLLARGYRRRDVPTLHVLRPSDLELLNVLQPTVSLVAGLRVRISRPASWEEIISAAADMLEKGMQAVLDVAGEARQVDDPFGPPLPPEEVWHHPRRVDHVPVILRRCKQLRLARIVVGAHGATMLPLATMPRLQALQLVDNDLDGHCLSTMGIRRCVNLIDLRLALNQLTSEDLLQIGLERLSNLRRLSLRQNYIRDTSWLPQRTLASLQSLELQNNPGLVDFSFGPTHTLAHLNLSSTFIHASSFAYESFAKWFNANQSLQQLHLMDCRVDDGRLTQLRLDSHPRLDCIDLAGNNFGDSGVIGSGMLKSRTLRYVSVKGCFAVSDAMSTRLFEHFRSGKRWAYGHLFRDWLEGSSEDIRGEQGQYSLVRGEHRAGDEAGDVWWNTKDTTCRPGGAPWE